MADRDELVRRALVAAAAPRPLAPATRDRLAALVRADADAGVAALLRAAALPRPLPAPTLEGLRARLSAGVPARVPAGGLRGRITLALLSAAAAVVLLAAVVVGQADVSDPVARPAPTGLPTAPPAGSEQPAPSTPSPSPTPAVVAPGAGEAPRPVAPGTSGPAATTPPAAPVPGEAPPGEPAAPGEPGPPAGEPEPQRSVSGVAPAAGPLVGGTVITVWGSGLSAAVRIEVGGRTAGSLSVESDSELTAETPEGARAGRVPVVVVMADGARYGLSPGFTYVAPPVLAAISPDRGPVAGGNTVVLSGDGFRADAVVHFGTARAEVLQVTPTSIEVVAPEHFVGTVDVTVTTLGGTSAGRPYTYLPA